MAVRQPVENFIKALRAGDVRVSVAEAIDAHNTIAMVGYGDRGLLKDSLAITVAKSEAEKWRFDEIFERFFERTEFAADADADVDAVADGADSEPGSELQGDGPGEVLAEMILDNDTQAMARAMEAAANAVGATDIRFFTQRGYLARRILDAMGLRELERLIAQVARGEVPAPDGGAEALEAGRRYLLEQARDFMVRQYELYGRGASERLREEFLETTQMSNIDPRDFQRMQSLVRRLAKRLASRYVRRRKSDRRGQLDIRRTMRANMANDGIPFHTVWKQRKIEKPKIVAICDVSRSVAAAARFLLLFLYNLQDVVAGVRAYAFSDRLIEISALLDELPVEEAVPKVLEQIGFRPTDYGRALSDFEDGFLDTVDRRTTVIMLGDGRSNNTDPKAEILKKLFERSRRMIWLNPEPETLWGTGDSEMPRYRPYCHVATTCNTVKHLERVIDDILKSSRHN